MAKKSRRTTTEQSGDTVKVDIEAMRQASVGAMTQMLSERFRFGKRFHYDELKPLLTREKMYDMRVVSIKICEVYEQVCIAVRPFLSELNLNEASNCIPNAT